MFKNILVAIDGSKCARKAFERAVRMAEASGGSLTIIHVLQLPSTAGFGKKLTAEIEGFFRKDAKLFLAEHAQEAGMKGVRADTVLARGNPAQAILHAAESAGADVIIIGSRGLGGMKGLLLGSVSHAVVQHASVPVLVVR
jgi:nucleotide-binding universal stress UspA family protein